MWRLLCDLLLIRVGVGQIDIEPTISIMEIAREPVNTLPCSVICKWRKRSEKRSNTPAAN